MAASSGTTGHSLEGPTKGARGDFTTGTLASIRVSQVHSALFDCREGSKIGPYQPSQLFYKQ